MDSKSKLQLSLVARKRDKAKEKGFIPAIVYGQKIGNFNIAIEHKDFINIFKQSGENTLINLHIEGEKKSFPVLVHEFQKDPLSGDFIHIDFYKPDLEKEVTALVPIKFIGVSGAVKDLGATLVKNVFDLEIKALPLDLPHEIIVDITPLENFGDEIFVEDIKLPEQVKILKDSKDIIVNVSAPTKVEEELEKPIEEKVEEVKTVKPEEKEGTETEENEEENAKK
jgi:large subunit ribosomal protein L25